MRIESLLLAAACAAVSSAYGVGLSITPASPTPADTLVIEVTGAPPCASMAPSPVEMVGERVIRVRYNDGRNVACVPETPPPRATLGRLPAGTYTVELVPFFGDATVDATASLVVTRSAGGPLDPPPDDYSGHYMTDAHAEGVTVFQQGKTAFISLMYYGADGQPRWAVMPDARWGLDEQGGFRFFGPIWRVEQQPASPGQGTLFSQGIIAMGSFYPSGILGRALLKTQQPGIPEMPERLLTRLRF